VYDERVDQRFKAWRVVWTSGAPESQPATAEYYALERSNFDALYVRSADIGPGCSGGPLWDADRHLVVGMVRREIRDTLSDVILATDSRAIAAAAPPRIRMQFDRRLKSVIDLVRRLAEGLTPPRHAADVDSIDPEFFIEPAAALALPRDPLMKKERPPSQPVLRLLQNALENYPLVQLSGIAGVGKSTVLRRFALSLIDADIRLGDRPVVPIIVTAHDIVRLDFDVRQILLGARARFGGDGTSDESLLQSVRENDAALVLLVDGLDEVDEPTQAALMAQLSTMITRSEFERTAPPTQRGRKGGKGRGALRSTSAAVLQSIIVATRPTSVTAVSPDGRTRAGYLGFEVEPFDFSKKEEFVRRAFPKKAEAAAFKVEISRVKWDRDHPTPLQLKMAATMYRRHKKLPARASDLSFEYARRCFERAANEKERRTFVTDDVLSLINPKFLRADVLEGVASFVADLSLREEVDLPGIRAALTALSGAADAPEWVRHVGPTAALIASGIPSLTGLYYFEEFSGARRVPIKRVRWIHRTFAETLAAQWQVSRARGDGVRLRELVNLNTPNAVGVFELLAAMEREGAYDVVKDALKEWTRPLAQRRDILTALRAFAAGVDANGQMRAALLSLLIKVVLAPEMEEVRSLLCEEVFSSLDLPSPIDIMKRPEFRGEVVDALRQRFQLQSAYIPAGRLRPTIKLSPREAEALKTVGVWRELASEFDLVEPSKQKRQMPPVGSGDLSPPTERGNGLQSSGSATTIWLRDKDNALRQIRVDSAHFVEHLVRFARAQPALPGLDLVLLYASYFALHD
jgi:hypothetical protein